MKIKSVRAAAIRNVAPFRKPDAAPAGWIGGGDGNPLSRILCRDRTGVDLMDGFRSVPGMALPEKVSWCRATHRGSESSLLSG